MNAGIIEHRGTVQRVEEGKAVVAMETRGCGGCGHESACGIGQLANGRAASLISLPVHSDIKVGDQVNIALRESCLTLFALFGYLFPVFAMMLGAWFGVMHDGSDGAAALGAMAGFIVALLIVRLVIRLLPGLAPAPQVFVISDHPTLSQQEYHHECRSHL
ncbi:Positive regulator of sigma(E), RseC/MucC [Candidatus Propionivibrio aalborgensis]|uniref:Positive regulator of sigma(E), RseC/MucC n=1 Tax=Candidatus Propionivibrio aalborgensis TaxID=1860101 RepID=A0A1A8Y232_9RHOO|nr:SoxR reducing system RseC family protein [Candidatus Propionivibrio aalborgensis]SBT10438.1 Positive regulator of sigma(E), RseC/MucC [Candidatus Propionivibrio aalborgensis]